MRLSIMTCDVDRRVLLHCTKNFAIEPTCIHTTAHEAHTHTTVVYTIYIYFPWAPRDELLSNTAPYQYARIKSETETSHSANASILITTFSLWTSMMAGIDSQSTTRTNVSHLTIKCLLHIDIMFHNFIGSIDYRIDCRQKNTNRLAKTKLYCMLFLVINLNLKEKLYFRPR